MHTLMTSVLCNMAARRGARALPARLCTSAAQAASTIDTVSAAELSKLPRRWLLFSDLHVQRSTLPVCVSLLRQVAREARARQAGVICLGDFWQAGGLLHTRQLNRILDELQSWDEQIPLLMIPGNHDQVMRGDSSPLLHALTPLRLARPSAVRVFSKPTLLDDSLFVPYGTSPETLKAACESASVERPLGAIFCHADVVGGIMNENGVLSSTGLPPEAFPPLPTRVYSGHYHKPHVVSEPHARGRHIQYVGSPYQTSMAEAGQRKALLVLDREAGWDVEEAIPLDIGPRHHVFNSPADEELTELSNSLRPGDRVLVLSEEDEEVGTVAEFAKMQRRRGVAIEVRKPVDDASSVAQAAAAASLASTTGARQPDLMQPSALFEAYATARNLSDAVVQAGRTIVEEVAARASSSQPPPLELRMGSVTVEGFGCFASRVEYPLSGRGMLLLRGMVTAGRPVDDEAEEVDGDATAISLDEIESISTDEMEAFTMDELSDDDPLTPSNGAGKTTLAMAPLWALTGSTDPRADGKPIEARGVINDLCSRAVVTLRGELHTAAYDTDEVDGAAPNGSAGTTVMPFEIKRTMGKREHSLRFILGETLVEGTLAQVQEQMDQLLRSTQLARVAFFGQHLGGGLLDKTDAALKAELQSLLPLGVWEAAREGARSQATAAKDAKTALVGEMTAAEMEDGRLEKSLAVRKAEHAAWEAGRLQRVEAKQAELDGMRATGGEVNECGEDHAQSLEEARAASEAASTALESRRNAMATVNANEGERVRDALAAAQNVRQSAMEADSLAARAQGDMHAANQRIDAMKASVKSWGWGKARLQAAKEAMAAGEKARLESLDAAEAALGGATYHQKGEDVGVDEGVEGSEILVRGLSLMRALESQLGEARGNAIAARQLASEVVVPPGADDAADERGICGSCGQMVTMDHLRARRAELDSAADAAEGAAAQIEGAARRAREATDGHRLSLLQQQLTTLKAEAAQTATSAEAAQEELKSRRAAVAAAEKDARALEVAVSAAAAVAQSELTALQAAERVASASVIAAAERVAEGQRQAAVEALRETHARAALAAIEVESNPHELRLTDAQAQRDALVARRGAIEAEAAEAASIAAVHNELTEHFGKRGVQNMLYTLALSQLEASAGVYAGELSDGRLQLRLDFDEQLKSIRKSVRLRRSDGSLAARSISQLSGGEWRRVALALSLAFADLARMRTGVSCNVLVLDEVMQQMDIAGQSAMARVIKALGVETTIVIAHGLASDELYGDFDQIDVVERAGDTSIVRTSVASATSSTRSSTFVDMTEFETELVAP